MSTVQLLVAMVAVTHATRADMVRTTYSGFLVDTYCYGLCQASSRSNCALDGTNVITDPKQHTIHCLRDPPQCYADFYLAVKQGTPEKPEYHIKFRLDTASNSRALELLRTFPYGGPKDHIAGNFTVKAAGWHNGDGYLRNTTFELCDFNVCDSVCHSGMCDERVISPPGFQRFLKVPGLIWAHVICMLLSWGCLLPLGILWARNLRTSDKTLQGAPIWFGGHRLIQSIGWAFQLVGFWCVFFHKQKSGRLARHFSTPHEILGLIVVIIGSLQPLNAQMRHLACVGHPDHPGQFRKAWEFLHKGCGYMAVIMGVANVILGISYANSIGFADALIPIAATFASISLGIQIVCAIRGEVCRALASSSIKEDVGLVDVEIEAVNPVYLK